MRLLQCRKGASDPQGGFTLVEAMVTLTIIVVSIGFTWSSIASMSSYTDSAAESSVARAAISEILTDMRTTPLAEVFTDFNGVGIDVEGLDPQPDDADGAVGRVVFPTAGATNERLIENLDAPEFGLPFDLNLDGAIDGDDRSGDYRLLPYQIFLEWRGKTGNRRMSVTGLLSEW